MDHRRGQWTLKQIKCAIHLYQSVSCTYDPCAHYTYVEYVCSKCGHQVQELENGSWTLEQIRKKNRQRQIEQQIREMGG
jgi:DNA-directed RNA polymerase subunit RPC12/RpoP